jgi:hypothetical protein
VNNALTLGIHRVPYGIKLHIEANSEHGEYDIHKKVKIDLFTATK